MNWRIVAIPVTLIPIILIAIQFDIKIEDILAIGIFPFVGAIIAMMIKLGLQGVKFAYITRKYLGNTDSFLKLVGVRVGSEFIKFTTPMFIGAEFVVIYYLKKKGIELSKATWIALVDIVTEVLAAGLLSMLAGIIALLNGAYVVGIVILATSISITTLWMVMFFLSSKHTFQVPNVLETLVTKLGKEKGTKIINQTNNWMEETCTMIRENIKTPESKKIFTVSFLLSMVSWSFYGISFMIIAMGTGYIINAFDSIMAVMGANAIGNLPITIGGSGLAEFGIVAYLNNLNPFDFSITEGILAWDAVIGWRIATYYVPIAITWLLLVKLALSKIPKTQN
ncbi:flippase-like domain-containing protein [Nitrosopumilus sp.]|nr:lysylphosphatidylglycerol synthase transmembrane domain-containing protein [Nitrosopumilus sp.]MDB4850155.1 flippase-like domain-containing protein [Nitrosopumilus sp.]MDC0153457.1 flippase-like domain-containing protein [Nitrosopumilus sp.]MDC0329578.1 flippase-like domain-containing protein [Nitrosopumilus sp.]MDC0885546.1 lysylphosphatidylglycerol synthase transmembrane domain-containing protein [Nitrosopumilus sp.]